MRNVDCLVSPFEKRKLSPRGIAWGPSRGHSALLLVLGLSLPPSLGKICLGRFSSMNPFGRPFLALLKVGSTITSRAGVRVATVELIAGCPSEIRSLLRFGAVMASDPAGGSTLWGHLIEIEPFLTRPCSGPLVGIPSKGGPRGHPISWVTTREFEVWPWTRSGQMALCRLTWLVTRSRVCPPTVPRSVG